jgi:Dyp-type peroxidase family
MPAFDEAGEKEMSGSITLANETAPFDASAPQYQALLANLQGNILTSHGRHFSVHTFFKFGADIAAAKSAIRTLRSEGFILSAAEQAAQTLRFKQPGAAQEVFGTLLLSAHGLNALGLTIPPDFGKSRQTGPGPSVSLTFGQSMRAAAAELGDTPSAWETDYQQDIDGLLIVAYGNSDANNTQAILNQCYAYAEAARIILERGATVITVETGHAHLLANEVREHFGFVDGLSQPLFRTGDLDPEKIGPTDQYDPGDGLINLVIPDPFTDAPDAFASFFVFRKLEQNVAAWRAAVVATANTLGTTPELAGAMAVGRFQNGDPVLLPERPGNPGPASPLPNNFTFAADVAGTHCPYHAHIRKSNPRGDTDRNFGSGTGALTPQERARRIARRGVSYGNRAPDLSDAPATGVGLLFMCYQANIPDQFGFIQKNWVNNASFGRPEPVSGQDAVIGQGSPRGNQTWPTPWGGPATVTLPDFGQFVTNKGGEFFLAVSIPTIEAFPA